MIPTSSTRVRDLHRVQANAAPFSAPQKGRVELRRETAPLEPAVDRNRVEIGLGGTGILMHRAPRGPAIQEVRDGGLGLHDRHNMTNLVIGQQSKTEIDAKLVTPDCGGMSTSQEKLKEKLLTPGLRTEMRADRIGERLALLREALGLSPAEISQRLDTPPTYWSRFEGGKRALTETIAAALVERYGVTLDFLILGKWDKLPSDLADRMRAIKASREAS